MEVNSRYYNFATASRTSRWNRITLKENQEQVLNRCSEQKGIWFSYTHFLRGTINLRKLCQNNTFMVFLSWWFSRQLREVSIFSRNLTILGSKVNRQFWLFRKDGTISKGLVIKYRPFRTKHPPLTIFSFTNEGGV